MKPLFGLLLAGLILWGCSSSHDEITPQIRRMTHGDDATFFHKTVQLNVGWHPYEQGEMVEGDDGVWAATFSDSAHVKGALPAIQISYPDTTHSLTVGMDIDDALLGKLIKHSLMTEVPIERPFDQYLQEADCAKCHPQHVKLPE